MKGIGIHLSLFIAFTMLILLTHCGNDGKSTWDDLPIHANSHEKKERLIDDDMRRELKIDSSNFSISFSKKRWDIRLETQKSFQSQVHKLKLATAQISKKSDLKALRRIIIYSINEELLYNIALVPEIQKDLIRGYHESKTHYVNSMGIVSPNAHKASHVKEIITIFQRYGLEAYSFYIDKCRAEKSAENDAYFSISCATISFKLREMKRE